MNERIKDLARISGFDVDTVSFANFAEKTRLACFAELIVKETLNEVAERAYSNGDRNWSDEYDRPWIELVFGYGKLAEAQKKAGIK